MDPNQPGGNTQNNQAPAFSTSQTPTQPTMAQPAPIQPATTPTQPVPTSPTPAQSTPSAQPSMTSSQSTSQDHSAGAIANNPFKHRGYRASKSRDFQQEFIQNVISPAEPVVVAEPKESSSLKKPIIVGVIALVVITALTAAVLMISRPGGVGPSVSPSGSGRSSAELFNRFANYLISGKEENYSSINNETLYNGTQVYYELQYARTGAKNQDNLIEPNDFVSKTKSYLDEFKEAYTGEQLEDLESVYAGFAMYAAYINSGVYTDDDILSLYIKNQDSASNAITSAYNEIGKLNYDFSNDIHNELVTYANQMIDLYTLYDENGCIMNGKKDSDCVSNTIVMNDVDIVSTIKKGQEIVGRIYSVVESIVDSVNSASNKIMVNEGNE